MSESAIRSCIKKDNPLEYANYLDKICNAMYALTFIKKSVAFSNDEIFMFWWENRELNVILVSDSHLIFNPQLV